MALTFDDGPGPYTNQVLDALEKGHAKASFFMLGPGVQALPDTVRRMQHLGMGLGDGTWSRTQLTDLSDAQVTDEIQRTAEAVKKVTGTAPIAVRPPYGAYVKGVPHAGFPFVLWDVDTQDLKNRSTGITTQKATAGAHPGAIILMHDSSATTAKALPGIISALQKRGYALVTLNDLIPDMTQNGVYSSGVS